MSVSAKEKQQKEVRQLQCQEQCIDLIPYYLSGLSRTHFSDNLSRRGGSTNRYQTYPNLLKRLKKVEKLHRLRSWPIFSECCEPFDFPTGISGFLYVNGKYPMASLSLRPSLPRLLSHTTRAFLVTIFPEWRSLSQDSPRLHHCFPHEMTSEKRAQKFHTDDAEFLCLFRHFAGKPW